MCMEYTPGMLRINIYIPEELNQRLNFAAQYTRKLKAEVVREALDAGLKDMQPASATAKALLVLAAKAKRIPTKGKIPPDFIKNLDYYTWGGKKSEQ